MAVQCGGVERELPREAEEPAGGPDLTEHRPVEELMSQLGPEGSCLTLGWGEEHWQQMEWCVQRPGGKSDSDIFSSRFSLAGEYGERQEAVRERPLRRAECE